MTGISATQFFEQQGLPVLPTRSVAGTVIAVMVAWNGRDYLAKAVESIQEVLRPEDDLLVVDNASTDGSFEYLRKCYPEVAILRTSRNLGGAGGFNVGALLASQSEQCQFIWLLDNDIVVEAGALQPLLKVLTADAQAAAAGSQICLMDKPGVVQEIGARYSPWLGALQTFYTGEKRVAADLPPYTVDYLAACSLLVKADVIRRTGLFKDFFVFYDDVEFGLRLSRAGSHLWAVPGSVVRHHFSELKPTQLWREYYRKRNRAACLAMHPPSKGGMIALWVYLVACNYRIFTCKFFRNIAYFNAYLLALNDFLSGRLGHRVLPAVTEARLEIDGLALSVYVGVGRVGDALAIIKNLSVVSSERRFYLPRKHYRILQGLAAGLGCSADAPTTATAIVDEDFTLSTALKFARVYVYRPGSLELVSNPCVYWGKGVMLRCLAICCAVLMASVQLKTGLRRYRGL